MMALLQQYAIPLIATVVLPMFIKPTTDSRPLWKIIMDKLTKTQPPTPDNQSPSNLLSLLGPLLVQLLNKQPPAEPVDPNVPVPKNPQDLLKFIFDLLQKPSDPGQPLIPPVTDHTEMDEVSCLVRCAESVAAANPGSDVTVLIVKGRVKVEVEERAESQ